MGATPEGMASVKMTPNANINTLVHFISTHFCTP